MITDPEKTDKNGFKPTPYIISDNKCTSVVKAVFCLL
jgi:hypothetical protein